MKQSDGITGRKRWQCDGAQDDGHSCLARRGDLCNWSLYFDTPYVFTCDMNEVWNMFHRGNNKLHIIFKVSH